MAKMVVKAQGSSSLNVLLRWVAVAAITFFVATGISSELHRGRGIHLYGDAASHRLVKWPDLLISISHVIEDLPLSFLFSISKVKITPNLCFNPLYWLYSIYMKLFIDQNSVDNPLRSTRWLMRL